MTAKVRLLIADIPAMRAGIAMALEGIVEVCGEVGDADSAIRAAYREQPDACLVARELAGGWLGAVRGVCRAAPKTAIVVLAQTEDVDDLVAAVRAGAIGYVPGVLDPAGLRGIVAALRAREAVIPRSMVLELLLELRAGGAGADSLTTREAEVLGMLRRGHNTATIAQRLGIAPVTVRRHVSGLVQKLGVPDRSALTGHSPDWGAAATAA